jgi:hypothetical protein
MALAMEEHTTTELLGRNDAIAALNHEVELLEGEKAKLSADVAKLTDLRLLVTSLRTDKEKAEGELICLKKQVEDT